MAEQTKRMELETIVASGNIAADYESYYTSNDIILIDSARVLAEPSPLRIQMNAVVICTAGKAQMRLGGSPCVISTGQIMVCPPNVSLTDFMLSPDFEVKAVFVTNRMLQSLLQERMSIWTTSVFVKKINVVNIDEEDMLLLTRFYDMIYMFLHSEKERKSSDEVLQTLIRASFICLCDLFVTLSDPHTEPAPDNQKPSDSLFRQFLDLLASTPVRHQTVEWYASELCITPKYLSTVCKANSGKTANEWIREHVLEDIRFHLKQTDLTIKQVSMKLGFPNTSFFGKYVKEHFGMTPLQFRQRG